MNDDLSNLIKELDEVVTVLDANGIEYAVCGGLALTIHGFPRATFDLDVLIREENLEKAFRAVRPIGYDIHGLDISFKERTVEIRRISKIDVDGEVLSLDFLLVTPFVEDVWQDRMKLSWEGKDIWLVSREGLIKMKRQAGRHKDLIDIDRIQNEDG
jgi:hypothetical protein